MQAQEQLVSIPSEKAVLGAILISKDAIGSVESTLTIEDFSQPNHQRIYEVCLQLALESQIIDAVIVKNRLQEQGYLVGVGGFDYLLTLAKNTPDVSRIEEYAQIVSRYSTLRGLERSIFQMANLVHNTENQPLTEIFNQVRGMVDAIAPISPEECLLLWVDSFGLFYENQLERLAEIEEIENGTAPARAAFPWDNLSSFVKWIRPETFGIVAADSSVGKTSFLECIAEYNAKHGLKVVFFHLELSHQTMLDRRMARISGVPLETIEAGKILPEMQEAETVMREYSGGVHYVHCPNWTARRIVNYARMLHTRGQCDLAVVDYLQKVQLFYRRGWSDENALADVGEVIKNSAELLGMPYLLGSQMNRASKMQKRRTAIGIRGSGQLEEKSNLVITLDRKILNEEEEHNGVVYDVGDRSPMTNTRIDKNSFGRVGDTMLCMIPHRFSFGDVDFTYLNEDGNV